VRHVRHGRHAAALVAPPRHERGGCSEGRHAPRSGTAPPVREGRRHRGAHQAQKGEQKGQGDGRRRRPGLSRSHAGEFSYRLLWATSPLRPPELHPDTRAARPEWARLCFSVCRAILLQ
jgi:hypothetical protein